MKTARWVRALLPTKVTNAAITALVASSAALSAALFCAGVAQAGPMGFKDSSMAMGDFGPNWRELTANYAYTARDAVGAGSVWMRSDDHLRTRQFTEANYTRLLKRINSEDAQANFWLQTSVGSVSGNDFAGSRLMLAPGLAADYETPRVYFSASARLYRARGLQHDTASLRAGFSFYATDYDETQPWLLLELRRMRALSNATEVTPLLRLVHNRFFIEAGVSTARQARFNLMYIF